MLPFFQHPSLRLLPEGALWIAEGKLLVVADIHLGKSAAFRARGLPVPEGDTARDLKRLLKLTGKHNAAHLVIAGDLFHAPTGITPELDAALVDFISRLGIPITLVAGNHDVKIQRLPARLTSVPHLDLESHLRVIHDPAHATGDRLNIAGHWHPVVRIPDGRRTSLRLPCFLFRNNTLVLPAFGSFTGGAILAPDPDDRVFVPLRDEVVEIPLTLIS
jgi:DNA ligase-associated metallophosphoesterase